MSRLPALPALPTAPASPAFPAFATRAVPGLFDPLPQQGSTRSFALGPKGIWIIGVAAVSTLLILLGIAASRMRPDEPRTPAAAASVVRVPAMALTAAPAELPTLEVRVTPASATLMLDGVKVQNPLKRHMEPDGRPHGLRVEAPGYRTESRSLVVEAPMLLEIVLVREPDEAAERRAAQAAERVTHAPGRRAAPPPARAVARPEPDPSLQGASDLRPAGTAAAPSSKNDVVQ